MYCREIFLQLSMVRDQPKILMTVKIIIFLKYNQSNKVQIEYFIKKIHKKIIHKKIDILILKTN